MTPPTLSSTRNSTLAGYLRVADLWNQGLAGREIAIALSLSYATLCQQVKFGRAILGTRVFPNRPRGRRRGQLAPSALARLRRVADTVIVAKALLGTRQNVHQLAAARGWQVRLKGYGDAWVVTAVAPMEPLSRSRRNEGNTLLAADPATVLT